MANYLKKVILDKSLDAIIKKDRGSSTGRTSVSKTEDAGSTPAHFANDPDDPFYIPPKFRRTEPVKKTKLNISREIVMPKPKSEAKRKREHRALKKLGYPYHVYDGAPQQWIDIVLRDKIKYQDPREEIRKIDAKIAEVVKLQRQVK